MSTGLDLYKDDLAVCEDPEVFAAVDGTVPDPLLCWRWKTAE